VAPFLFLNRGGSNRRQRRRQGPSVGSTAYARAPDRTVTEQRSGTRVRAEFGHPHRGDRSSFRRRRERSGRIGPVRAAAPTTSRPGVPRTDRPISTTLADGETTACGIHRVRLTHALAPPQNQKTRTCKQKMTSRAVFFKKNRLRFSSLLNGHAPRSDRPPCNWRQLLTASVASRHPRSALAGGPRPVGVNAVQLQLLSKRKSRISPAFATVHPGDRARAWCRRRGRLATPARGLSPALPRVCEGGVRPG